MKNLRAITILTPSPQISNGRLPEDLFDNNYNTIVLQGHNMLHSHVKLTNHHPENNLGI